MDPSLHSFKIGDRVRAVRRPEFPGGTVMQLLDSEFLLVRWGNEWLETAHHNDVGPLRNDEIVT
jgi:hypothetical protein